MAALTPSSSGLDRNQNTFLKSNFVVYDPVSRKCNQDFSKLESCQVILIGEFHNSSILKAIQRKFLEIIIGNQLACLIAEGLKPGETFTAPEKAGLEGLPSTLQVRGGDVREQWSSTAFLEWVRLSHRVIQLQFADKEVVSDGFRQIAAVLNDHFRANPLGIDAAKKVLLVTDGVVQAVDKLVNRLQEEKNQRDKEIEKIHAQMKAMRDEKDTDPTVVRSNQVFFEEVKEACVQFSKVVAIWGKAHYVCDDELIKSLNHARLSYVILLPNAQRESEASDEIEWATGATPLVDLTVRGTKKMLSFKVPKIFQSYFHPAIQSVCQTEAKEPLVLDIQKLLELAKQENTLNFPANQEIHFEHAPLSDYHRLEEFSDFIGAETKMSQAESSDVIGLIVSILNNIAMVGGLKVASFIVDGQLRVDNSCLQNKLVLILSSDKPFHLTLAKNKSLGYAWYLFQEMKRLNMKTYSIAPQGRLCFIDISDEEIKRIKGTKSPNELADWLTSKLPPHTQLKLEGQISVQFTVMTLSKGSSEVKGIVLTTNTGITFTLT